MLARTLAWLATAVVALLGVGSAPAQTYPARQIELIVPFVAGGTTDNIARMLAQRFSDRWRQTVVVSNRPGGGSTIGTLAVAKAAPDGHTLLVTTIGFAITASLQKLPYDVISDFAPVTELASVPLVLVVHASVPVTTLPEFIALAKSQPGGLDYASSGTGTSPHLAAEMFCAMAGVKLVHVPFKGNAEGLNAMLGGHVQFYFALLPAVLQHSRAVTRRPIAVRPRRGSPHCPTSPPSPNSDSPITRSPPGRACSRRPARPRTSWPGSTPRPWQCSTRPRSASASPRKAPTRSAARRINSPSG